MSSSGAFGGCRCFVPNDLCVGSTKQQPANSASQRQADDGRRPKPARHPADCIRRGLSDLDYTVDHQQDDDDDR